MRNPWTPDLARDREWQRKWLLTELEKDHRQYLEAKRQDRGNAYVFYGRVDALVRVWSQFDFGDTREINDYLDLLKKDSVATEDLDPEG